MKPLTRMTADTGRKRTGKLFGAILTFVCIALVAVLIAMPRASSAANLSITVNPSADTFVRGNDPDRNFGAASHIDADARPQIRSLLRFSVGGVGLNKVVGARLRLHVDESSSRSRLNVFSTATSWDEMTATWNNQPALGQQVASLEPISMPTGSWVEVDLGQAVFGDGTYSFALTTDSNDRVGFDSRTQATGPQLLLTLQPDMGTATSVPIETPQPIPQPTPPTNGQVLWSADHETGDLSQWTATTSSSSAGGVFNSGTGSASVTTDVAHSGTHAVRMTISGADGTNGDQAVRVFRWKESRIYPEAYYSVWYYFPQTYQTVQWWNIFQFKSVNSANNDVFWKLEVRNRPTGEMYLILENKPNAQQYQQTLANLPVGKWVHVEVYYKQSANNTGHITVWQDGKQLFDFDGITTMFPDATQSANWSVDDYTDSIAPSTATIYIDDAAISTARIGP